MTTLTYLVSLVGVSLCVRAVAHRLAVSGDSTVRSGRGMTDNRDYRSVFMCRGALSAPPPVGTLRIFVICLGSGLSPGLP